ncbi:MAG TPA: glycosyltransferase [Pyrinomonadaceae bacterium]|nr:glycosyltransferase [Pyrinomonadaceae bacterium]
MKPNVLLFIDSFHQGGTERQVVQLARLLAGTRRYNLHLACLTPEGVLRAEAERLGFTDIPAFPLTSFYGGNFPRQVRRFARLLGEREIDLVETHDFYTNIFGMTAAALARTRVRVTSRRESDGVRSRAQLFAARRAFDLSHACIANAEAVRQEMIRAGVRGEKIVTIYNGIDTARLAPRAGASRAELLASVGLPAETARRFVTVVANLRHPMKDQETFLRAANRVAERFPEAAFVLAGEGERAEHLRSYAAAVGLADKTFFTGRCERVADLLAVSEVCVLSSKSGEGFSNAIAEYMAAARPVVATDVGGAREAVVEGETGHVVPAGDDATMAERVVSLLADPARARAMGESGARRVREQFSCEAQLARTEELYERLLAKRRANARSVSRALEGDEAAQRIRRDENAEVIESGDIAGRIEV